MEKRGDLTPESKSDFNSTDKARYADKESLLIAGEADKHRLKAPVALFDGVETILKGKHAKTL